MQRFWEKVNKTESCWLWQGHLNQNGYGGFTLNRKAEKAHRVAWWLSGKTIPKGKVLCHSCDVRICVNPSHLWLGTLADNNRDMANKGRRVNPKGEQHGKSKLSESDVYEIKRLYSLKKYSNRQIGDKFNVTKENVYSIVHGLTWGWLPAKAALEDRE